MDWRWLVLAALCIGVLIGAGIGYYTRLCDERNEFKDQIVNHHDENMRQSVRNTQAMVMSYHGINGGA